jgi:hypothetical protein
MTRNVTDGRFRFVVLMDAIGQKLKDLLNFINQNSEFSIYGVEVDYYKHDGYEIVIPNLHGAEVRKVVASSGVRNQWTREKFDAACDDKDVPPKRRERTRALLKLLDDNATLFHIVPGTGAKPAITVRDVADETVFSLALLGRLYVTGPSLDRGITFESVQHLMDRYAAKLKWSQPLNPDMANWPRLMENIEDIPDDAFAALKEFLLEFAKMRAGPPV